MCRKFSFAEILCQMNICFNYFQSLRIKVKKPERKAELHHFLNHNKYKRLLSHLHTGHQLLYLWGNHLIYTDAKVFQLEIPLKPSKFKSPKSAKDVPKRALLE